MSSGSDTLKDYLIDEFVLDYHEGRLTRRDALIRLVALTGSLTAAGTLLACAPAAPQAPVATSVPPTPVPMAATVVAGPGTSPNDPDLMAQAVQFPGPASTLLAYLARPKGNGPFPAVMIAHENQGTGPHYEDVARRYAKAGYAGLVLDQLSRQGGSDKVDQAQRAAAQGSTPITDYVADLEAAFKYLQEQPFVRKDRIGITGFCAGGGLAWRAATKIADLKAAVPFYGAPPPPPEEIPNIRAAVLAIYGEQDANVNRSIPDVEAAMKQHNKTYEKIIYPGAQHAFFNDTRADRYHAEASRDAWLKALGWFDKYLKA